MTDHTSRPHGSGRDPKGMTPTQVRTFDELLAVGGPRPTAPIGLIDELKETIAAGTAQAVERWTENRLYVTKAQLHTALRCEGQLEANALMPRTGMNTIAAVGVLSHRAIQIAHTHPGNPVAEYVKWSLYGAREEQDFSDMWDQADPGIQSDMMIKTSSMVTAYLDSWPVLDPAWTPRFEENIQAKIGKLTLSSRADLVLGRPRPDMRQTMFLCDFKTGMLKEEHDDEGAFYALVAALRHGVPPYRSSVYSLASGEWSNPDVTSVTLRRAANRVVEGVNRIVDVLSGHREASLSSGDHCRWCPVKDTCVAHAAMLAETALTSPTPAPKAAHPKNIATQEKPPVLTPVMVSALPTTDNLTEPDPFMLD